LQHPISKDLCSYVMLTSRLYKVLTA
ncbi:hypothetical protein A2U01_0081237, partial [Trifolium medium]|nr:hypothetical protein [Trifolium medium]